MDEQVPEWSHQLTRLDYQITNLRRLPQNEQIRHHIDCLMKRRASIMNNVEQFTEDDSSSNSFYRHLQNIYNAFTNNKLMNVSSDVRHIIDTELAKTVYIMSAKPNYRGQNFEDVDISQEPDKDNLVNIDKVLRDLHYYDQKLYIKLSNEFNN